MPRRSRNAGFSGLFHLGVLSAPGRACLARSSRLSRCTAHQPRVVIRAATNAAPPDHRDTFAVCHGESRPFPITMMDKRDTTKRFGVHAIAHTLERGSRPGHEGRCRRCRPVRLCSRYPPSSGLICPLLLAGAHSRLHRKTVVKLIFARRASLRLRAGCQREQGEGCE